MIFREPSWHKRYIENARPSTPAEGPSYWLFKYASMLAIFFHAVDRAPIHAGHGYQTGLKPTYRE
ncbi:MAG TPA: hypothetical protein VKV15_28525 [Bryobacteraceae bacterium]|nr:hypothetical protein [Bryobacteraceae bacterium]